MSKGARFVPRGAPLHDAGRAATEVRTAPRRASLRRAIAADASVHAAARRVRKASTWRSSVAHDVTRRITECVSSDRAQT